MAPFPPTATCVLPMNADEYYRIQDHPAFRSLLAQVMDQEVEVLDVWYKGDVRVEKVINRPDYEKWVPKVGRRFVKPDDIAFIDEMEYAPKSQQSPPYQMQIKSLLPLLGDRVSIHRVVIISEEGPDTCRHTITGDVTVRVPAIGRMVEKYVMTNTVAAMSMLGTVVDRYKTVQSQLAAEEGPPEKLPSELETILQAPYTAEEAKEMDLAGEILAEKPSLEAEGTPDHPVKVPLERTATRYFDAEEDLTVDEESLSAALQRLESDQAIPDDDDDDVDDDEDEDESAAPGDSGRRSLSRRERHRRRNERARKFFTELGSLSISRRRHEAKAATEELKRDLEQSEEAKRWNRDKERWDNLWRGARVRAAPIPKALARVFTPLRIHHSGSKGRLSPVMDEGDLGSGSSSADDPDQAITAAEAAREKKSFNRKASGGAFVMEQAPHASRGGSTLITKMRLKREQKG